MRSISIVVRCDACQEEIEEQAEGDSLVQFTACGVESEMDLCDDCLYRRFLHEARPTANRRQRKIKKQFACSLCPKSFGTQRGLSAHDTRTHNP